VTENKTSLFQRAFSINPQTSLTRIAFSIISLNPNANWPDDSCPGHPVCLF